MQVFFSFSFFFSRVSLFFTFFLDSSYHLYNPSLIWVVCGQTKTEPTWMKLKRNWPESGKNYKFLSQVQFEPAGLTWIRSSSVNCKIIRVWRICSYQFEHNKLATSKIWGLWDSYNYNSEGKIDVDHHYNSEGKCNFSWLLNHS